VRLLDNHCPDGAWLIAFGKEKDRMLQKEKEIGFKSLQWASGLFIVFALLTATAFPAFSGKEKKVKNETIGASAMGTGSQMGQIINVSVEIYDYSTPEDKQVLVDAFSKGQNQGLVNALTKMRAVGHISITGTLGYDLAFVRMIPTPTGRKIHFVTNRQLTFGEVFADSQSMAYNLTGGELNLDDQDKKKSTGVLYPACQLALDKEGQLQVQLNQNAWKLVDVLDWQGTPGVN
jgi:hypothetical protein